MALNDILLALISYPEPSRTTVIDQAVEFASVVDAKLSAIACEVRVEVPGSLLADAIIDVRAMAAAEARKSLGNAEKLLTTFEEKARRRGVFYERILDRCLTSDLPDVLVDYARLRDLTIIGAPDPNQGHWFAESIIFGSGRPTLIIPAVGQDKRLFKMEHVVVAWDFSQQAARAVADSMTILEKAKRVSVVTITNEKEIDTKRSGSELAKHLALHGVSVVLEQVDAAGRPIGGVLESYVGATQADLLVMGAYGHSRLREFVLGGATRSMLSNPPLPLLLSR